MSRDGFISVYLYIIKIIFGILKLFPLQNKTVFLSSFGNNALYVAKEISHFKNHKIIFLNQKSCIIDFSLIPIENKKIYTFESTNLVHTFCSLYHLATSKYVFIDSYVGILSAIEFKKDVKCVQLWHAAGAIKRFGWSESKTNQRSERAKTRFQKVYNSFQFIPIGSVQMANIFSESFHLEKNHYLSTGVPQTDFYFDSVAMENSLNRVIERYPVIKGKKVVLYAPTFRKEFPHKLDIQLDINDFLEKLDENYVLLIRSHPSVKEISGKINHPRIILVNDYPYVNELLVATDILITDYSSIPFEFSFLRKKMIFFAYDLESYHREQGLWSEDSLFFPGPVVKSTSDIIEHIIDPTIDFMKIDQFRQHWNNFSTGRSTRELVSAIYDEKYL